ncbi:MAG TPA: NAD(P)-dependent alcohol dehydrogenase [Acidimicrobiia bacterium]|nr:NAD(P)-dependent alcohol dehydrogenase [Acidimicrobiia bacterium]
MRATVIDRYGTPDVLRLEEVDTPIPGDGQVLVRVRASSVNPYDWHFLTGRPKLFRPAFGGLRRPKYRILGADLAGQVEAVGSNVTRFVPGDEVYGQTAAGAYAEYVAVAEAELAPKPANLTFEQAAAVPLAGFTALQAIRDKGKVQPGQKVLINGASGGVGTLAVQIAKVYGAEVTGVCSTANVEMVRSIGADHVIDYTRDDFASKPQRYDLLLDNVGNRSLSDYRRVLAPKGIYLASHGQPEHTWLGPMLFLARAAMLSPFVGQKLTAFTAQPRTEDLHTLKGLIEAGTLTPVIDRAYSLAEVPEAFRFLEQWHARGKVVITI